MGAATIPIAPARAQKASWLREFLSPSLCDVFFLAVIAWSFMTPGTGWSRLLWDGDVALHTAIGNWVLDHAQVPVNDPFSFTLPGSPWLAVEWGTGVVFALLDHAFGLKGIVFLSGVIIAALLTVVLRTMLTAKADTLLSLPLALLASNAISLHYSARPHLFTLLFLAITAWIITKDRGASQTRWIWALPPLTILWVNLHPGFAILFAYLGALVAGSALECKFGSGSGAAILRYGALTAACGAATLVNPFGWKLHAEVVSYFRASGMSDLIQEFQAPAFRTSPQLYFMVFLFAGLALCGLYLAQKRFVEPLWIAGLAYASLISVRHSTIFVVIVAPLLAAELSRYWRTYASSCPKASVARILDEISTGKRPGFTRTSFWALAGIAAIFLWAPREQWPTGFDTKMFPVEMAARHPELATARMFTTEQWADYLLYRNYPQQRVFYDDRSFYGEKMFRTAQELLNGAGDWQKPLNEAHTELVMLEPGSLLAGRLREASGWKLVDSDKTALLFARQDPK